MLKTGMIIAERYEIVSKIGTGGMADVYKAMDHKLNRFVAVKVLKPEFREDATFVKKFRSEAQAAAGLTHPNIVNVFDVGDDEGVYYIVMELIEGIPLKEYISKKGKLSVKEATSIAIQVSMGLEAAHSHGIVHRDVKPQNIIISTDGVVIRIRCSDVRIMGRYATGVRVMKVSGDDRVVSFTRAEHDEEAQIEEIEQPSEEELAEDEKNAQAAEANEVIEETAEPDDEEE